MTDVTINCFLPLLKKQTEWEAVRGGERREGEMGRERIDIKIHRDYKKTGRAIDRERTGGEDRARRCDENDSERSKELWNVS